MKRSYDSTVARIAGNIASGMINGISDASSHQHAIALYAVGLAREIIAETQRTEPVPDDAVGQPVEMPHLTTRAKP